MTQTAPQLNISITPLKNALLVSEKQDLQVLVRLQAEQTNTTKHMPLSVALVIDRSGSMSGDRILAAKNACKEFVSRLSDDDELGLVVYDSNVDVLLELMPVAKVRPILNSVLENLDVGGSTNLHGGWLAGAEILASRTSSSRVCRVVLLSDGGANNGIVNPDAICEQVKCLANAGVTTSTVGIGMGFNEELMTAMAQAGLGNAIYGDRPEDLYESFDTEISLLKKLAWSEVSLEILNSSLAWKMHNDYIQLDKFKWRMPSIASNSEAWMALSTPMDGVINQLISQPETCIMSVLVKAVNADGQVIEFKSELKNLPIVSRSEYANTSINTQVQLRFQESEAADLQRLAFKAVDRGDWRAVEALLADIEGRSADNDWLKDTLVVLKRLCFDRDEQRLKKELHYSSRTLKNRLSEIDGGDYSGMDIESTKEAFLRRKSSQGRRTSDI